MWFIRCFFAVFLTVGMIAFTNGIRLCQKAQAARSWPTAEARILRSEVDTRGGYETPYAPLLRYTYAVASRQYQGTRLTSSDYSTSRFADAERQTAPYPVGMVTTIHYNPDNPSEALLQPGDAPGALILLGVGGVFALIGGFFVYQSFRKITPSDAPSGT